PTAPGCRAHAAAKKVLSCGFSGRKVRVQALEPGPALQAAAQQGPGHVHGAPGAIAPPVGGVRVLGSGRGVSGRPRRGSSAGGQAPGGRARSHGRAGRERDLWALREPSGAGVRASRLCVVQRLVPAPGFGVPQRRRGGYQLGVGGGVRAARPSRGPGSGHRGVCHQRRPRAVDAPPPALLRAPAPPAAGAAVSAAGGSAHGVQRAPLPVRRPVPQHAGGRHGRAQPVLQPALAEHAQRRLCRAPRPRLVLGRPPRTRAEGGALDEQRPRASQRPRPRHPGRPRRPP
ncbi:hypothetical protein H632_c4153p0, partial [Helicosporidium sp. ATCC 50920]